MCSAGTEDRQDVMLARIGLTAAPSLAPIRRDDCGDQVRVMFGSGPQQLSLRFLRLLNEMARMLGLAQALGEEPSGLREARVRNRF
jgi:hypothetical protein